MVGLVLLDLSLLAAGPPRLVALGDERDGELVLTYLLILMGVIAGAIALAHPVVGSPRAPLWLATFLLAFVLIVALAARLL